MISAKASSSPPRVAFTSENLLNDVHDLQITVAALKRTVDGYRSIINNMREGVVRWTADGKILFCNKSFLELLDFTSENDPLGKTEVEPLQFCTPVDRAAIMNLLMRHGSIKDLEMKAVRLDGSPFWININARRVAPAEDAPAYFEMFVANCTAHKLMEDKVNYQAYHDTVTGLGNRQLFRKRLFRAILRALRMPGYKFSVIYLNLNRFKLINAHFDRRTGDEVLRHVATAVTCCLRELDTVARFGGDKFAVLVDNIKRGADTVLVAQRIQDALGVPFKTAGGIEISLNAGVGIVLRAERYSQPDDILRDASTAMSYTKGAGARNIRIFNNSMRDAIMQRLTFENELRQGLDSDAFSLVYQPIVNMENGALHGFEALLRWTRNGKSVSPAMFIPVAEENGFINKLGLFVIEQVCAKAADWSNGRNTPLTVHLNISGRQLTESSFPGEVQRILKNTGVDPEMIIFEITETVLLDDNVTCMRSIYNIRNMGIRFCLDDFGTGYSSLSYLRMLPVNCIKIDKSFVNALERDKKSIIVMQNLLKLGEDLKIMLIVEGIESDKQAEILKTSGCKFAQGFFYHRPMPAQQAEMLLEYTE
jgi:diguanylate cyclase (GGDEF)-like protein/PAS domain S-box-containing protein